MLQWYVLPPLYCSDQFYLPNATVICSASPMLQWSVLSPLYFWSVLPPLYYSDLFYLPYTTVICSISPILVICATSPLLVICSTSPILQWPVLPPLYYSDLFYLPYTTALWSTSDLCYLPTSLIHKVSLWYAYYPDWELVWAHSQAEVTLVRISSDGQSIMHSDNIMAPAGHDPFCSGIMDKLIPFLRNYVFIYMCYVQ